MASIVILKVAPLTKKLPVQVAPWTSYCVPHFPHTHYWYNCEHVHKYSKFFYTIEDILDIRQLSLYNITSLLLLLLPKVVNNDSHPS